MIVYKRRVFIFDGSSCSKLFQNVSLEALLRGPHFERSYSNSHHVPLADGVHLCRAELSFATKKPNTRTSAKREKEGKHRSCGPLKLLSFTVTQNVGGRRTGHPIAMCILCLRGTTKECLLGKRESVSRRPEGDSGRDSCNLVTLFNPNLRGKR